MPRADSSLQLAFIRRNPSLLRFWSGMETFLLGKKICQPVRAPVFVCGLARSGTSLVTRILACHASVGSYLYRDLPFVEIPYLWSFVAPFYYGKQESKPREHGDQLSVDPDSPDAFEELLWKTHIARYDEDGFCAVLDARYENAPFASAWDEAIRKVLYVRGGKTRYLAKGNYNLFRLTYIFSRYPDAKVVLCVRNPFEHARSLARVHQRFTAMAEADPAFAKKLDLLGHYEFGPQRRAIRLSGGRHDAALRHWEQGEDYEGYLLQWLDAYDFAKKAYGGHPNILWLDQAQLLADPSQTVRRILAFCALPEAEMHLPKALAMVKGTTPYECPPTPYDAEAQALENTLRAACALR